MPNMLKNIAKLLLLCVVMSSCRSSGVGIVFPPCAVQYASTDYWYESGRAVDTSLVDVFYVYSTEVGRSFGLDGVEVFRAMLTSEERGYMAGENAYMQQVFGDSVNFFAPYYHQFTMQSLMLPQADFDTTYAAVRDEVCCAFDYYMANLNCGRPFALVGFSQGAMLVLDILKHLSDEQYGRMVGAYMLGYRLSADDMRHPHVQAADGPSGWGRTVSFNSVASPSGVWPVVTADAATCINPLNWRTDATPATLFFNGDTATVSVDTALHVLMVRGLDAEKYRFPPLEAVTPQGNMHHWDILFYANKLRENLMHRAYDKNK